MDAYFQPPDVGVICELNRQGEVVCSFGSEYLRRARGIVIAPNHAAKQGFTPGNLFIIHDRLPEHQLNDAAIIELSPEGKCLQNFCGSQDIGTRMSQLGSLAFAPNGGLLVPSRWLTDTLLIFTDGGSIVQRFADGCFNQVCVSVSGKIYATQKSGIGCIAKVFDSCGRLLAAIGGTPAGVEYYGIAVNSQEHLFLSRLAHRRSFIDEFDAYGEFIRSVPIHGLEEGLLAIDDDDCLYVPCQHTGDIKVLSPNGRLQRRIDLRNKVVPYSIAIGENGHLWVSEMLADKLVSEAGVKRTGILLTPHQWSGQILRGPVRSYSTRKRRKGEHQ